MNIYRRTHRECFRVSTSLKQSELHRCRMGVLGAIAAEMSHHQAAMLLSALFALHGRVS